MKTLDRLLQRWRIRRAALFIPNGARLLDIGCADGTLYRMLKPRLGSYVGIDPGLAKSVTEENYRLLAGSFPDDFPQISAFDVITMLAVVENLSSDKQDQVIEACVQNLATDGVIIVSTPSPIVDRMLWMMKAVGVVDGMSLDDHYGFETEAVPQVFDHQELEYVLHQPFELGLNHLFVFRKKSGAGNLGHEY